jgi:hypothetical protein
MYIDGLKPLAVYKMCKKSINAILCTEIGKLDGHISIVKFRPMSPRTVPFGVRTKMCAPFHSYISHG